MVFSPPQAGRKLRKYPLSPKKAGSGQCPLKFDSSIPQAEPCEKPFVFRWEYDEYLYKLRHLVENAFRLLKRWRGIDTLKTLLLSLPLSKSVVLLFSYLFIDGAV